MPDDVVVEDGSQEIEVKGSESEEQEGKTDPKLAQEKITPENPRFKEVYGKMKDFERKLGERDALVEEMKKHNTALVKAIEKSADATREAITAKGESETDDKVIDQLNTKLSELKTAKLAAKKAFDFEAETKIDDDIMEVRDAIKEASAAKKEKKSSSTSTTDDEQVQMLEWAQTTPWYFGDTADPLMRAAAHELDRMLVRDPKWGKVSTNERLIELGKRIEARFKWTAEEDKSNNGRKKPGGVEGAGGEKGGATKVVRLSAAELSVARGLGISAEEYAKQKSIIEGGK